MLHRVVIVGAGYAGLLAAARLARAPGVAVTVVEPSPVFVERIRLHQRAAGQRSKARALTEFLAPGVRWVQTRATAIELAARRVRLADGQAVDYDQLVLAIGSVVERERVPGVREHCLSLQTDAECRAIAAAARGGGRAVVVGLGMTGIEAACELAGAHPGLAVTLLGRGALGEGLSAAGEQHLREVLARLGVRVIEGASVEAVTAGQLRLEHGACEEFSLCVWAAGFRAPTLAAEAGLPVAADGRVRVDASLRVPGHPEVLVIGDAARVELGAPRWGEDDAVRLDASRGVVGDAARRDGAALRMACATAMPMGAHAAEQVLRFTRGEPGTPLRFAAAMLCVSLGRGEGLIQLLTPDDRPRARVLRGIPAAVIKEAICRMTVVALRAEARGVRVYRWLKPEPAPALSAAALHS